MLLLNTHLCTLAVVFFSTSLNSQFDLSYDRIVSGSISQLIKGLQCSQLQPLGVIVRTSFHHVCFILFQFDKGSDYFSSLASLPILVMLFICNSSMFAQVPLYADFFLQLGMQEDIHTHLYLLICYLAIKGRLIPPAFLAHAMC